MLAFMATQHERERLSPDHKGAKPPWASASVAHAEEQTDLRSAVGNSGMGRLLDSSTSGAIEAELGGGKPLDSVPGAGQASRGKDAGVRLHDDGTAADLSRELGALAFTFGRDLFLAGNAPSLESSDGQAMLRHELSHVDQQSEHGTTSPRRVSSPDSPAEHQAAHAQHGVTAAPAAAGAGAVRRQQQKEEGLAMVPADTIHRWAREDVQQMQEVHAVPLEEAFAIYANEAASPSPGSRKEAIRQAIRDRLGRLADGGYIDQFDHLERVLQASPELTAEDGWLMRVVHFYRRRLPEEALVASDTGPPRVDPGLAATVGAAASSGTLGVAIYTPNKEREFRRAARQFAADHVSVGIQDGQLVVGEGAAMAAGSTGEIARAVAQTIGAVRSLVGRRAEALDYVALFAHGVNTRQAGGRAYLNLSQDAGGTNHQIGNADQVVHASGDVQDVQQFADQTQAALADRGRVVLYACELGDSTYGGENADPAGGTRYSNMTAAEQAEARQGARDDEAARGEGSFADTLRDLLNATGGHREVWGHRTTGHTTLNATWRRYGGGTTEGAENDFGDEPVDATSTATSGRAAQRRNISRANEAVGSIVAELRASPNIPAASIAQVDAISHGLREWVARELPFAPPPFVAGDPPEPPPAVIAFLERSLVRQYPPPERVE